MRSRRLLVVVIALLLLNAMIGPVVVRLPIVRWTYADGQATAGWTLWPLVVVIDVEPVGLTTLEHELCHWRHPFWPEWACDALDDAR